MCYVRLEYNVLFTIKLETKSDYSKNDYNNYCEAKIISGQIVVPKLGTAKNIEAQL